MTEESKAKGYTSDLEYLEDELKWIRARAVRIRIEQMLRRVTGGQTAHRSRGWQDPEKAPSPAALRTRVKQVLARETTARTLIDTRLAQGASDGFIPALDRLCQLHSLTSLDRIVLLLAAAPILDRSYDDLVGALSRHGEGSNVTIEAALAFADLGLAERLEAYRRFAPQAPLIAHDLIVNRRNQIETPRDLIDVDLDLPSRTFELMVGRKGLHEQFLAFSAIEEPRSTMAQVVLPAADKARILSVVDHRDAILDARRRWGLDDVITYGRGTFLLFHGQPGTGKTMTAHAVAHHMGLRVLNVDLPTFVQNSNAGEFLPGLFREARLQNALLFFDECETLFESRGRGNALMTILLTEIEKFEGVAILATNMPQQLDEALDRRILVRVAFPAPDREARREIWRKHLPAALPLAKDVDLDVLAERFDLSGGYIKNAVLTSVAEAVQTGGKRPKVTMAHLMKAAQAQAVRPLDTQNGDCPIVPKACLADVMLPEALRGQVEELVDAARCRRTVLDRWGVGRHLSYGKGVSALFHGDPGTGKTLCAEAVAGELNRPLLLASIPGLLSKWVGQSEQNVQRLFARARTLGAVLFLDEADSLLTQRESGSGSSGSRHDASMVNVLLTELERHDGIVLLATNLPGRLDGALERRLTYRLEFPLPNAVLRADIWRRLLPETVPIEGTIDFNRLGEAYGLSGGLIKNAVFKCAFRVARLGRGVSQVDLERAAADERGSTLKAARPAIGFAGRA